MTMLNIDGCLLNEEYLKDCNYLVDVRGAICPIPILRLEKTIEGMVSGQVVNIITNDPIAKIDIPFFCQNNAQQILLEKFDGVNYFFKIRKT